MHKKYFLGLIFKYHERTVQKKYPMEYKKNLNVTEILWIFTKL